MYSRLDTKKIKVGNISIGHSNNVVIQSMCNTKTNDVKATVRQIKELEEVGAELVRISVPDEESAKAISDIKEKINIPLVADIHFDYRLALLSIDRGIDKIRINPGNIGSAENIKKVVDACKKKKIPIRIGVNSGSLSRSILKKYNGVVTAKGLFESAKENIKLLEKYDFHNIVVSIKASDVNTSIDAYKYFAKKYSYPMHLGITEAGTYMSGSIKSSVGLGILLYEGLGDTMRVSLTSNPVNEILVAKKILQSLNINKVGIEVISCPTCARTNIDIEKISNEIEKIVSGKKYKDVNKKYKIAIMGCVVNGPGEARDADIGIAGGNGEALIFKKGEVVKKIKEEKLISELIKYIDKDLKK